MHLIKTFRIHLAWIVSIVATVVSLSFSNIFGFIPCELCWYQRILMYPLVIILGIATYNNDEDIVWYGLPFSILGLLFSLYHIAIQEIPSLELVKSCKIGVPCSVNYLNLFGFITIPMLSFMSFFIISFLLKLKPSLK